MNRKRETVHRKLVRDKIPEIIENSGKSCETRILDESEYLDMLDVKLSEELNEYLEAHSLEELCDLTEVILASAKARGYSLDDLLKGCEQKRNARGGFDKRIFLEKVCESL